MEINNEQEIIDLKPDTTKLQAYKTVLKEYPDVLDVKQVSAILGISTKTAYKLLREQKIEYLKVGRVLRIPKINLLAYLKIESRL